MVHYKDFSACDCFGLSDGRLIAIGWLAAEHADYARGPVSSAFFESLIHLLVDPWQPVALAGMQDCFACRFTGGPAELRYAGAAARIGAANLFVPADDCVFVAPSLIAHYIDAHDYAPPAEFQQAVMNCPAMRSMAYLNMLRKHGLHSLHRA
jgi:hypothetical protein